MTESTTACGRLIVDTKENHFARAAALLAQAQARATGPAFTVAFSGGSTPQDWYRWCVAQRALPAAVTARAHFTVSDERHVPLADGQSNFGNATRHLLDPLAIPAAQRHPWPVELAPLAAVENYRATLHQLAGPGQAYDVCFLGMGDDAHTASLFPGTPLLRDDGGEIFAAQEVPGKDWRLTITPAGLRACGQIVVLTLGANKAPALARVINGPSDLLHVPSQILRTCAGRVLWLVDEPAAAQLKG
ncbi:MAG: 6-phosphogluconolactonase [Verrucomicrobiota bacterium]